MKRLFPYSILIAVAAVVSCEKEAPFGRVLPGKDAEQPISLGVIADDLEISVDTKTTAITSVPTTLYWGATTGGNAAGTNTETVKWSKSTASTTVNPDYANRRDISTGKYQTASPTYYCYYVSNSSNLTIADNTTVTVPNNNTDILCGRVRSNSATPSVSLKHIFSRTGTLTLNIPSSYSPTNVVWQIKGSSAINGTAGTYNLKTQSWTAASTTLSSWTTITNSSDLYLIPGDYTVRVSYTVTVGDRTYTPTEPKEALITFVQGKRMNITATPDVIYSIIDDGGWDDGGNINL